MENPQSFLHDIDALARQIAPANFHQIPAANCAEDLSSEVAQIPRIISPSGYERRHTNVYRPRHWKPYCRTRSQTHQSFYTQGRSSSGELPNVRRYPKRWHTYFAARQHRQLAPVTYLQSVPEGGSCQASSGSRENQVATVEQERSYVDPNVVPVQQNAFTSSNYTISVETSGSISLNYNPPAEPTCSKGSQPPPQLQPKPPLSQPKQQSLPSTWKPSTLVGDNNRANGPRNSGSHSKQSSHQSKPLFPKDLFKEPFILYCDMCRTSCSGPQTYWEHLEGQKHKKKEVAQKSGVWKNSNQQQLLCALCDVYCSGEESYLAHINGAKHQKVLSLFVKLDKHIPSAEPVIVNRTPAPVTETPPAPGTATASATTKAIKPLAAVGKEKKKNISKVTLNLPSERNTLCASNLQPVGRDYVEEVRNREGKLMQFHCKLCDCFCNHTNTKEMHLRGRRHRLQYKKVNPEFPVENKYQKKDQKNSGKMKKRRDMKKLEEEREQLWYYVEDIYCKWLEEEQLFWEDRKHRCPADLYPLRPLRRPTKPVSSLLVNEWSHATMDQHIMMKHSSIYPTAHELQTIQTVVSHLEQALKLVSDSLACEKRKMLKKKSRKINFACEILMGVTRVGTLAKGLLLHGDRDIHLILISAEKPTKTLLEKIVEKLPEKILMLTDDKYEITPQTEEACLVVTSCGEPKLQVKISITSPLMEDNPKAVAKKEDKRGPQPEPADLLNRNKCLESLTAIRQTKWFQTAVHDLQSGLIIIRILRDLCQRDPTWRPFPQWALEILVEKALSSAVWPLSPEKALRRTFECVASGILLSAGPGLQDPCETEPVDTLKPLTPQEREAITVSAQNALRNFVFRQMHKILGDNYEVYPPDSVLEKSKRKWDYGKAAKEEAQEKKYKKGGRV
ncbi:zinc finger RNA-binding protein 2 isoform X3 [Tachyglossus aculeatus]|uniref:zinc finger RNA-binding protein 2 isoform X3 n=1 Tax=Tachyglossus aculeatus TaxID=9261 RepID=UPI0018F288A3|nr:zinc finger RNA-binding protein 2 isoform X3 [Tachyglossus aculeatus]